MTFEVPLPLLVAGCCFAVPVIIGTVCGIVLKDKFYAAVGVIVGTICMIIGAGVGSFIDHDIANRKAREATEATKQAHLETMPDDWKGLHKLLQKTESSVQMQKAYVTDFLKDKTKPEISIDAYVAFCFTAHNEDKDDEKDWKLWLAEVLMPHTIIDVKAAIGELE